MFAPPCLSLLVFDEGFQDFLHVGSCLHHGAKTCFEKAQLLGRQLQPVSQGITYIADLLEDGDPSNDELAKDLAEQANENNLERLGMLVRVAEATGLYLDVTGLGCYHKQDVPAWYDALDEAARWDVQADFWRAVAGVCRDSPAIFCYDLMNEPILAGAKKKETDWLAGDFAGKHFVQRISLDLAGRTRIEVASREELRDTDFRILELVLELPPGDHVVEVLGENLSRKKRGLLDRLRNRPLSSTARAVWSIQK